MRHHHIIRALVLQLLVGAGLCYSQPISINLRLQDRPPKSLSEWIEKLNVVSLRLENKGIEPVQLKIRTVIRKDSQVVAYTRFNDAALINVEPGQIELGSEALLSSESLEILPEVGRSIVRGGQLSPGNYTLCCQLLDASNPDELLQCSELKSFTIGGYDAPQLSEPGNYRWVARDKPLQFKWKAVQPLPQVPRLVRYKFLLYEAPRGVDPMYVIETLEPMFEKYSDNVSPLSIVLPLQKMELSIGKQYIWTVQAVDQDDRPYGDPDGKADPFVLRLR